MDKISEYLHISPDLLQKLIVTTIIIIVLSVLRAFISFFIKRKNFEPKQAYYFRRTILYTYSILIIILIGPVWIRGIGSISTFLGLASAGLAIAMHDTIANITGWFFILWRKPFKIGDRIQINETAGDVIDIRLFQFSIIEIGNWVDADQSSGRIIHVPNSKVLRDPLANYHIGFEFIWHEIPVLITFESDWQKTKKILTKIVNEKVEHLTKDAEKQVRKAAEKYLVFYGKFSPIVYTTVKDSGVLLTIRFLVDPRQRRKTEQDIWEAILLKFETESTIDLAYPTTRFYSQKGKALT